jgi:hypothetical protein
MHDYADVRGQLRADRTGDAMCAGACHAELASATASAAHSHHDGVLCVDCHMPRIVFGIRTIHRSHRIEVPRPLANEADGRPDACTSCHVDRSAAWAAGDAAATGSRIERDAFAGDPIERAIAAAALGRDGSARSRALALTMMRDDPYPAVRGIAWRGVRGDRPFDAFTPTDDPSARAAAVASIAHDVGIAPIAPADVEALRAAADAHAIEIGE